MEGYKLTGLGLLCPKGLYRGFSLPTCVSQLDPVLFLCLEFSRLQHNVRSASQPRPHLKITWRGFKNFSYLDLNPRPTPAAADFDLIHLGWGLFFERPLHR